MACWLPALAGATQLPERSPQTAEALYLRLRSVGLEASRVFQVREASLDRPGVHISFDDGTLAFTEDVCGRVTGAFFEGEGEVLMVPPDRAERSSMALFTGAAILEEKFTTAYLRFNDDTFEQLDPALRPGEGGEAFVSRWNETAHNLAYGDALRLLLTFSHLLPVVGEPGSSPSESAGSQDRMLHARLQGEKLGVFDVFYDSTGGEQVSAGRMTQVEGLSYYDVWTAFTPLQARPGVLSGRAEPDRKEAVSVARYRVRAQVNPPRELDVDTSMDLEVQEAGQRAVVFELSRFLKVKSLEADGKPVEFIQNPALEGTQLARRGNDQVVVVFPKRLRPGQKITLRFVYGGEVLSEAGGGLLYVGARGTWYPNRGMAMSEFDLEFRYPAGWTLVATGRQTPLAGAAGPSGEGGPGKGDEQVSRWVTERPIPVAGFNLGRYERAEARAGDVLVESYAAAGVERTFPKGKAELVEIPDTRPPASGRAPAMLVTPAAPSPARNAQAVADTSARAVEFFAERFGPYPYGALALTQMPGRLSQGWPGLVFLSSYAFLSPEERAHLHPDAVNEILDGQVMAHETAHQWWGDLIVWKSYRDQWVFEGLANYCALMILETQDPAAFRSVMQRYRDDLVQKNKNGEALSQAGPVSLGVRLSSSRFPEAYEAVSYGRGTWLFHMLRTMLRDGQAASQDPKRSGVPRPELEDPFVRALHQLRNNMQGKTVTTRDVVRVLEQELPSNLWFEGKKSLDWFVDGWVNGTAVPELELKGAKLTPKGNSVTVSGTIVQRQAPKDLVTSVPVYARQAGGGMVLLGRVFADGEETAFVLAAPVATRKILLDPNQTLLTRAH